MWLLIQSYVCVLSVCLTLYDPMDYSRQAPLSVGILQARILEWVAISFSRGSSRPRNRTRSPTLQADSWPSESPGKPYRAMKACYLKCYGDTQEHCFCFLKSAFHIFHFSCLMALGIQVTNHVTSFSFWLASLGFPGGSDSKESAQGLIPESGRLLKKGVGTHSSILAWRIPWTKEPGGLQSTASPRVRHNRGTNTETLIGLVQGPVNWITGTHPAFWPLMHSQCWC